MVAKLEGRTRKCWLCARRLRLRVRAAERARVARELHDGVVQSLVAVEMQLAALRHKAFTDPGHVLEEVALAQQVVRREILNVRGLMDQLRPVDLPSSELVDTLAEIVDRFRRETTISASFLADAQEVTLHLVFAPSWSASSRRPSSTSGDTARQPRSSYGSFEGMDTVS